MSEAGNSIQWSSPRGRTLRNMNATNALPYSGDRAGNRILASGTATSLYTVGLAATEQEIHEAQTLRFLVFNLELGEGLEESYNTLRDEDPFDSVCDHLVVKHVPSGDIVGTYRLQTGAMAAANRGFYSATEFEFAPFVPVLDRIVELGRACVSSQHRNMSVLGLLWKGILEYATARGARYLIGCSSLSSTDPGTGAAAYAHLSRHGLAETRFRTRPTAAYRCPMDKVSPIAPQIPKLLRAYMAMGARICGEPALDSAFGTIDFLTLHDLETAPSRAERTR
jgi:putative hemolysin